MKMNNETTELICKIRDPTTSNRKLSTILDGIVNNEENNIPNGEDRVYRRLKLSSIRNARV